MTLGEKLKLIEDFVYRSAKQSFGVFGVDADPSLALVVMEGATNRFRAEAAAHTQQELFNLEEKVAQTEKSGDNES